MKSFALYSCFLMSTIIPLKANAETASCVNSVNAACSSDPAADSCLEIRYACGEYMEILDSTKGVTFTPSQTFFVGVSLLAQSLRESAPASRCYYEVEGQTVLENFLRLSRDHFNEVGSFGTRTSLRRVNYAVKMLKRSQESQGKCLRSGLSLPELENYAKVYTQKMAKQSFLGGASQMNEYQKELRSELKGLLASMQDLITLASAAESSAAMSDVEMRATKDLLNSIKKSIDTDVGTITYTTEGGIQSISRSRLETAQANNHSWNEKVDGYYGKLKQALQNSSPEEFEKERETFLKERNREMARAKQSSSLFQETLNFASTDQPFPRIVAIANNLASLPGNGTIQFEQVMARWKEYGKGVCVNLSEPRWYCKR